MRKKDRKLSKDELKKVSGGSVTISKAPKGPIVLSKTGHGVEVTKWNENLGTEKVSLHTEYHGRPAKLNESPIKQNAKTIAKDISTKKSSPSG